MIIKEGIFRASYIFTLTGGRERDHYRASGKRVSLTKVRGNAVKKTLGGRDEALREYTFQWCLTMRFVPFPPELFDQSFSFTQDVP